MHPRRSIARRALPLALMVCCGCSDPPADPRPRAYPTPEQAPSTRPRGSAPDHDRAVWRTLDPPAAPGAMGANLRATEDGLVATWIETSPGARAEAAPAEGTHAVRLSILRGQVWSEPTTVVEGPELMANWADFPRAARGGDGSIYVTVLLRGGGGTYSYDVQYLRSTDDQHFDSQGLLHHDGVQAEHGFVSMVPTTSGLRVFWLDGRATGAPSGAMALFTARVGEDVGERETARGQRIDERTCDCCQTDAATTANGPIVAYRDRGAEEVRDIAVVRWDGTQFLSPQVVHEDGWQIAGCPVNGPAIDARGSRVAVAWFSGAAGGAAQIAFSVDAGASFSAPVVFDDGQPPGRVDVALVEGGAAVSWLARSGDVRVRYVRDDGRLGASTTVGSIGTGRASGFPVLARDGGRLLVIHRGAAPAGALHVSELPISSLPREPSAQAEPAGAPAITVGSAVPAMMVMGDEGAPVDLRSLGTAPLIVAFFASWCQPCREELRTLQRINSSLDSGAQVVAVSIDEGGAARATAVARRWGFAGRVVRDAGAASALGVPPVPAMFVIRGGRLSARFQGRPVDLAAVRRATGGE